MGRGDFTFADDTTIVICAPTLEHLRKAAARNVGNLRRILRLLPLVLDGRRTKNLLCHPDLLTEGMYRISPAWGLPNAEEGVGKQRREAAVLVDKVVGFDPHRPGPEAGGEFWEGFPYPVSTTMRPLGVALDPYLTSDAHYANIAAKA